MARAAELAEVERLGALLDASPRCETPVEAEKCEDLAFLAGEVATREKIRRFLNPPRNAVNWWVLRMGLFISRDPAPAIAVLEDRQKDLTRPGDQIDLLSELRVWSELPALTARATVENTTLAALRAARLIEVRQRQVTETLATLPRRVGNARRVTATELLHLLVRNPGGASAPPASDVPAEIRQAILDDFAGFSDTEQGVLLQQYWSYIRDPQMLPHLQRLARSGDVWARGQVFAPLLDLDPDLARPVFIEDMLNRFSRGGDVLLRLPDVALPDIEQPLLAILRPLVASPQPQDRSVIRQKLTLLARYGTAAILSDMQRFYADWQRDPTDRQLGPILEGYFRKYGREDSRQ
jgi:hypothetical protein